MKKIFSVIAMAALTTMAQAANDTVDLNKQTLGFYSLNHDVKDLTQAQFVQNVNADYAPLFKLSRKVTLEQFVRFQTQQLDAAIAKRREMSLKQAHVRFGVINQDKDQSISLKEFQAIGLKTFEGFDKNQDGIVNQADLQLEKSHVGTHDGLRVVTPLAMPMPNNIAEFIELYGKAKDFVTLGDYLSIRDQQFFATDTNHDQRLSEEEYVAEFTQRYDAHLQSAKAQYQQIFEQQFAAIVKNKTVMTAADLHRFAQAVFVGLDVNHNHVLESNEL